MEAQNYPATARLYFEAHITVKPIEAADWEWFSKTASANAWRASRFDVDEVDHYDGAWFLSARDKELAAIKASVANMLSIMGGAGYEPIRWKIEDTVLDSKHGDKLTEEGLPVKVVIPGATQLEDWRSLDDNTQIQGGSLTADSIKVGGF